MYVFKNTQTLYRRPNDPRDTAQAESLVEYASVFIISHSTQKPLGYTFFLMFLCLVRSSANQLSLTDHYVFGSLSVKVTL